MVAIYESESALPPHIQSLLDAGRRSQHEWINNLESRSIADQHESMTIFGPFGGPARRAREELRNIQAAVRAQFKSGTGTCELVQAIDAGDTVVLVLSEKSRVIFAGREEPQPWELRITEVYVNDDGTWRRLHRHADPLQRMRPLAETLALLS